MSTSEGSTRCAIWLADSGVLEAAVIVLAVSPCELPISPARGGARGQRDRAGHDQSALVVPPRRVAAARCRRPAQL